MSFKVTVEPSGHTFSVEQDEPILMAAIRHGVALPYGCKNGACGSCKIQIKEGHVLHGAHQAQALNSAEEDADWILSCCATAQTDVVLEVHSRVENIDFPVRKMPARVFTVERPAPDVAVLQLQLPGNEAFRFRAGQYIDFILPHGQRRSYSMANAPHRLLEVLGTGHPGIELHIRHMPGGLFTDQVFSSLKARDILRIEGPYGDFFWREDKAKPVILLASGTGLAPIKALIEEMRLKAEDRPLVLYWGCRRPSDLYLHTWVEEVVAEWPLLRYEPVLSEPDPDAPWQGRVGLVHQALMHDWPDLSGHQVYACGAPAMVNAARTDLTRLCHLPENEFFADAFTSSADHPTALRTEPFQGRAEAATAKPQGIL